MIKLFEKKFKDLENIWQEIICLPSNDLGESFVNDWRRFQVDIFVQVYLRERGFQTEKHKNKILKY